MEYFFQDIEHQIYKHIVRANSRLLICVAWFTNEKLGSEIIKKKNTIDIEIVVDDNEINRSCANINGLIANDINVTFIKDLNKKHYLMHNKFCVIDNSVVITGSYNWTLNANSNDENICVLNEKSMAAFYSNEFRRIKDLDFEENYFSIPKEEGDEIIKLIYNGFVAELKKLTDQNNLNVGSVANWTDKKVDNKIRIVHERMRNSLHRVSGKLCVYWPLIEKYGSNYNSLATESEKVDARDKFTKNGMDSLELVIQESFDFYKIRTINILTAKYARMLDDSMDDQLRLSGIGAVLVYLLKEKCLIGERRNRNILDL